MKNDEDKCVVALFSLLSQLHKSMSGSLDDLNLTEAYFTHYPALRKMHRNFLLAVDRVIENLISQHFNIKKLPADLIEEISQPLNQVIHTNTLLLEVIQQYFSSKITPVLAMDLTEDMTEFRKRISQLLPNNLELYEFNPYSRSLVALEFSLVDLRKHLLILLGFSSPSC